MEEIGAEGARENSEAKTDRHGSTREGTVHGIMSWEHGEKKTEAEVCFRCVCVTCVLRSRQFVGVLAYCLED